jgi:hypothetical protein
MAKCYLMIEDSAGGLSFAADFGQPPESLPADVALLTEAQYATHQFLTVLRGMTDPLVQARTEAEVKTKILVPSGIGST